jgi:hypothetical protein
LAKHYQRKNPLIDDFFALIERNDVAERTNRVAPGLSCLREVINMLRSEEVASLGARAGSG